MAWDIVVKTMVYHSFCDRIQAVRGVHFWDIKAQDILLNSIQA